MERLFWEDESKDGRIAALIEPETTPEKYDAEYADKQDEGAAGHLINGDGCIEKAHIH